MTRQDAADANWSEPDAELDLLARKVVHAAFEVHRALGPGFLESVYEEALAVELALRGVSFRRQVPFALSYRGIPVGEARVDFLVAGRLVVELKASAGLLPVHLAQVLSYLKAAGQSLGLLINFNVPVFQQGIRRVIRTDSQRSRPLAR